MLQLYLKYKIIHLSMYFKYISNTCIWNTASHYVMKPRVKRCTKCRTLDLQSLLVSVSHSVCGWKSPAEYRASGAFGGLLGDKSLDNRDLWANITVTAAQFIQKCGWWEGLCVAHRLYTPALASRGDYLQKDHIEQCLVHCFKYYPCISAPKQCIWKYHSMI